MSQSRANFEEYMKERCGYLKVEFARHPTGRYERPDINQAWVHWQAGWDAAVMARVGVVIVEPAYADY